MPTTTTNYGFYKPLVADAVDEDLWGGYLNDNFDLLDTKLKTASDIVKNSITADYSIVSGDRNKIVIANATTGNIIASLPTAASVGDGFLVFVKKSDVSVNTVTVDPSGADTINGLTTLVFTEQNEICGLISDGVSNWNNFIATADTFLDDLAAAIGFSDFAESTVTTTITQGTKYEFTHGLASIPKLCVAEIVCTTANNNFAVGDRVGLYSISYDSGVQHDIGYQVTYNATKVFITIADNSLAIIDPTSGNVFAFGSPNTNFSIVLRVWA